MSDTEEHKVEDQPQQTPPEDDTPAPAPVPAESDDENVVIPQDTRKSEYMSREANYIDSLLASVGPIEEWHASFFRHLAALRAPILIEIQDSHVHLNDSQLALHESIRVVDGLIRKYQDMYQSTIKNTQLYNRPLHSSANHLPCISPTGQSNPGILSLASLSSYLYDVNIDYLQVVDQLKLCKAALLEHVFEFSFKPCYKLIDSVQKSEIEADTALEAYKSAVHRCGTQKSDLISLTAKKRSNIFQLRTAYIRNIIQVWKLQCELKSVHLGLQAELHARNDEGKDQMHQIILQVTNILLAFNNNTTAKLQTTVYRQQYAPQQAENYAKHVRNTSSLHHPPNQTASTASTAPTVESNKQPDCSNPNFTRVSPVVPSPIPPPLTKTSTIRLFSELPEDATRGDVEKNARNSKPPSAFPDDVTIVKSLDNTKKSGVFSDKSADLIYTKTHQIQLILHQTTNEERSDVPSEGFPTIALYGSPEWTLDGAVVIATLDPKKPNILLLKESHEGFFSMNGKQKVVFGSEAEAQEWMHFINNHNKFFDHQP